MILCIGPTPAAQRVMTFKALKPDAVNRAASTLDGAAGKSVNVAKVLAALGAEVFATGFVGGDRGREILRDMTSRGIETKFVEVPAPTRQCISVIDEATHTVTELVEESRPVPPENYDALVELVCGLLPECEAVVMSGSLTPGAPVEFYRNITNRANELGKLSVVDAQGTPLLEALKASPGLVKPNRSELAATVNKPLETEMSLVEAMREVRKRGAQRVVVTAGGALTFAMDQHSLWRIQPAQIEPVNPIGSGDAFTAALVWRLTQADSLGEACRWAAAAGAANALSPMPGDLEKAQVLQLLEKVKIEQVK